MKILLHDYAGHPFPVGLSRELVKRGHAVDHAYFIGDPGPKGALKTREGDPSRLRFIGLDIKGTYEKGSFVKRRFNDVEYGRRLRQYILESKPDVVITGNTPTEAQSGLVSACEQLKIPFVYWIQDFYSVAVTNILTKKFGMLGTLIGSYYKWLDKRHLRKSSKVVAITDDFISLAAQWSGEQDKVVVIENWGAIDEIGPRPRRNTWTENVNLADQMTFLYSGTLGLKHNPSFLVELGKHLAGVGQLVIVSQGLGVDVIQREKESGSLPNVTLLGVQPLNHLQDILASGDVLVAVIEKDAGIFSVPSKVLSYLCAGRPVLLAAPMNNLAARIVSRAKAGIVVAPDDLPGFLKAAEKLAGDRALREELGVNGRIYAERMFDVGSIADRFEAVLTDALADKGAPPRDHVSPSTDASQMHSPINSGAAETKMEKQT